MPITITGFSVRDIRFPTSRTLAGSDAMNKDPDYSAARCCYMFRLYLSRKNCLHQAFSASPMLVATSKMVRAFAPTS